MPQKSSLGEAPALSSDIDEGIAVDLSGKNPCFAISAESEKGFQDQRSPMTPDFADELLKTPWEDHQGKVLVISDGFGIDRAGRANCRIGANAKVGVNKEQDKFASAHDLRRAFGPRWASRVTPAILQQLMRHASIKTTLKYYVQHDADFSAESLWASIDAQQSDRARKQLYRQRLRYDHYHDRARLV